MNPNLTSLLPAAEAAIHRTEASPAGGPLHVGVDLGTAYIVMFVLGPDGAPLVGAYQYAEVVRDGVVVDFSGASTIVHHLKQDLEQRLGGRTLHYAATTYPPGVPISEIRATRYVLEAAGLDVSALVDEPTAANAVLGVRNGAVVDVGGGTTGVAIVRDGRVVATSDEPTGGHHLSLVLSGALKIPYREAEELKKQPAEQSGLLHLVRPVLEKIATIVAHAIDGHDVSTIHLVGGTSAFHQFPDVVTQVTGITATVPTNPLFVTPLGTAMQDPGMPRTGGDTIGRHNG